MTPCLRLAAGRVPIVGYAFRWAVIEDGGCVDLAATRRAALRRRPATPATYATVIRITG